MNEREIAAHDHPTEPTLSTITRRQAVGFAGLSGAAIVLGERTGRHLLDLLAPQDADAAPPACVLTPAKTEGPYFVDERLNRSDIRVDPTDGTSQAGVPVTLTFTVVNTADSCAPVAGAQVDVWHANATGLYSDEAANGTTGKKYLRGYQLTDASGRATFTTIFPGWYSGRTVHVHLKVRTFSGSEETYEFTSQLFFDPATTSSILATSAYAAHGSPDTTNATDSIYGSDGSSLLVPLTSDGAGGYAGAFTVGLSGLPASSSGSATSSGSTTSSSGGDAATNAVDAAVLRTTMRRSATGRRILRITLEVDEQVSATASVSRRRSVTLVRKHVDKLRPGTRHIDMRISDRVTGGSARLALTLTDTAGARTTYRRTVTIPRRATG